MKYLLWRLAADRSSRIEDVGTRIVADEVARMLGGDRWHQWREGDLGSPVVPGKVAWIEWAHDPRTLDTLPRLGMERSVGRHERFGAFCASFRIPTTKGARISKASEQFVSTSSWGNIDRLIEACPGGILCGADMFVCSWRAKDALWSAESGGRVLSRISDFEWVIRPDGSLMAPEHAKGFLYSVSGGKEYRRTITRIERDLGEETKQECYALFDRNAMVVLASFGLLSLGGARLRELSSTPAPVDYIEAQAMDRPDPQDVSYLDLVLAPSGALPPGVPAQVKEACRRDKGCVDLESIAAWSGAPYVLVSAEAARCGVSGVTRLSPDECDEVRRQREEEEVERLERLESERRAAEEALAEQEERLRREETERRRRERWESWKARRDASRAERERQAAARSRLQSEGASKEDDEVEPAPRPRWRPERRKDRADPLLGAVALPPSEDEDDGARPGPGYAWGDDDDLVHQGRYWRVVYATTPSGRSPARAYAEWLRDVSPGDWDSIMETIRIVADDPMGHMPVSKRFKCFSRPGYLLCEFKRSGLSGHARMLAFRDTRHGEDGKVERRIVLLHGFSKQTNATPEDELLKADSVRASWLSRR